MKRFIAVALFAFAPLAMAQSGGMKGMDMKDTPMKDMPMKKGEGTVHKATGVVTRVDAIKNRVTIKHEPVATLNWPPMTMGFAVKDKALMQKLTKDKKVDFEFTQDGKEFVVTAVK